MDYSELVGTEIGVGEWYTVDQDRIDAFADATDDHQWIHQAGEQAENGPFGGPIAHGYLTLSLLTPLTREVNATLTEGAVMVINYGLDKVRFITPVPAGGRIRGRVKLVEATEVANGTQLKSEVTVELEGSERPAAVIEQLIRVY
jgi:acyl dehydratase